MKRIIFVFLSLVYCFSLVAQGVYTREDSIVFKSLKLHKYSEFVDTTAGETLVKIGLAFVGKPYVASTLDVAEKEQLTINLREFDCTTFVETCMALNQVVRGETQPSFKLFMEELKRIRYRDGIVDGYSSRLHYVTDWVYENREMLNNVTASLGGKAVDKTINFMSSNRHLYSSLKSNDKSLTKIKEVEQEMNNRKDYTILFPQDLIRVYHKIKDGDIIVFGSKANGLDYYHIGIAYWQNNELKLIHASSVAKKVAIDKKDLIDYVVTSKACNGITVLRLK